MSISKQIYAINIFSVNHSVMSSGVNAKTHVLTVLLITSFLMINILEPYCSCYHNSLILYHFFYSHGKNSDITFRRGTPPTLCVWRSLDFSVVPALVNTLYLVQV